MNVSRIPLWFLWIMWIAAAVGIYYLTIELWSRNRPSARYRI